MAGTLTLIWDVRVVLTTPPKQPGVPPLDRGKTKANLNGSLLFPFFLSCPLSSSITATFFTYHTTVNAVTILKIQRPTSTSLVKEHITPKKPNKTKKLAIPQKFNFKTSACFLESCFTLNYL